MKEEKCYKKLVMNYLGSAHDKFSLNPCNSRINLINVKSRPCIISYYVGTDSKGKFISIYGAVFLEVLYYIEREGRKNTQIFLTTFNKDIYLDERECKIKNVSVKVVNLEVKRINEFSLVGYFTLKFLINLMIPTKNSDEDCNDYSSCKCSCSMPVNDECNEDIKSDCCEYDEDSLDEYEEDMSIMIKSFDEFMGSGEECYDNMGAVYNFNSSRNKTMLSSMVSLNNDYYKYISNSTCRK